MSAFVPLPPSAPRPTALRRLACRILDHFLAQRPVGVDPVDAIAPHVLAPVVWKDRDGLTYAEIARILDTTPADVAARVLRARHEIKAGPEAAVRPQGVKP